MKRLICVGMCLLVLTSLTGCKWFVRPVQTETVRIEVPRSLYPVCPPVEMTYNTIGEYIIQSEQLRSTYNSCKVDVDILIRYLEDARKDS